MAASQETVRPERYAVLWVDRWNPDTGEAVGGGRTIETVATGREAAEALVAHTASCARLHGPGECVVVDSEDDYRRVDPYRRQLEEEGWADGPDDDEDADGGSEAVLGTILSLMAVDQEEEGE